MHWWLLASLVGCFLLSPIDAAPQSNTPSVDEKDTKSQINNEQIINKAEISKTHPEEKFTPAQNSEEENEQIVNSEEVPAPKEETASRQVPENILQSPDPAKPITEIKTTTVKPVNVSTVKPVIPLEEDTSPSSTVAPERRYPCRCASGLCSCCTGLILENFNLPIRSRACANITYEPDDFAFNFKLLYNNRILYNTRMSAKNPRPVCIPINRYFGVKMCAKLSNVYMSGRNIHACLNLEGFWDDESAFNYNFNCFRIGSQGVAVVQPEDGGGLPPPPDEEEDTDEDYDDSARGWTGD